MIKITREDKGFHSVLRVQGHAGEAAPGEDIVCAAASILVWTLYINVLKNSDNFTADIQAGNAEIIARDPKMKVYFDAVMAGFDWLADNYPEYLKIV